MVLSPGLLATVVLNGLVLGTLFFLIAAGLSLIFGLMDVLNFAHGALFMWGAYVGWAVYQATGNFLLAAVAGSLAGALLGVLLERTTIHRLYGRPLDQILLTVGLLTVLSELVRLTFGPTVLGFPVPEAMRGSLRVLGMRFPIYRLWLLGLGAAVYVALHLLLQRTRLGLIVRAGVEDRAMVQVLGIDVRRVFTAVFALGALLAALGGVLAGPFFRSVWPQMGTENLLSAFIVVVIGGMGSLKGSLVGALIVGLMQSLVGFFYPNGALIVNFGLMAAVLLARPQGLFGKELRA